MFIIVSKLKFYAIIGSILFGLGVAGYNYYKSNKNNIDQLKENSYKLEMANKTNLETIEQLQINNKKLLDAVQKLNEEFKDAEQYKEELEDKLNRHDLKNLSLKKSGLIQKRANDATKKLFDDFESISNY